MFWKRKKKEFRIPVEVMAKIIIDREFDIPDDVHDSITQPVIRECVLYLNRTMKTLSPCITLNTLLNMYPRLDSFLVNFSELCSIEIDDHEFMDSIRNLYLIPYFNVYWDQYFCNPTANALPECISTLLLYLNTSSDVPHSLINYGYSCITREHMRMCGDCDERDAFWLYVMESMKSINPTPTNLINRLYTTMNNDTYLYHWMCKYYWKMGGTMWSPECNSISDVYMYMDCMRNINGVRVRYHSIFRQYIDDFLDHIDKDFDLSKDNDNNFGESLKDILIKLIDCNGNNLELLIPFHTFNHTEKVSLSWKAMVTNKDYPLTDYSILEKFFNGRVPYKIEEKFVQVGDIVTMLDPASDWLLPRKVIEIVLMRKDGYEQINELVMKNKYYLAELNQNDGYYSGNVLMMTNIAIAIAHICTDKGYLIDFSIFERSQIDGIKKRLINRLGEYYLIQTVPETVIWFTSRSFGEITAINKDALKYYPTKQITDSDLLELSKTDKRYYKFGANENRFWLDSHVIDGSTLYHMIISYKHYGYIFDIKDSGIRRKLTELILGESCNEKFV